MSIHIVNETYRHTLHYTRACARRRVLETNESLGDAAAARRKIFADDNHKVLELHESRREERWGAGVETQKNVRGEIGEWGRVPFNEPYNLLHHLTNVARID